MTAEHRNRHATGAGQQRADAALERVVVHQVGPRRRRALETGGREIESAAVDSHQRQRGKHGFVDRVVDLRKGGDGLAGELGQGIATAKPNEMDALAHVGTEREMIAPCAIDAEQRDRAFC